MHRIRPVLFGLVLALCAPVCAQGAVRREARVERITAEQLRAYLTFIASDELEGRNTPSRGLDIAAKYIASHLTRWGVKPAGDNGTYFQKIALRRSFVLKSGCKVELNDRILTYGEDYFAAPSSGSTRAPLVYAGYGWMIKAKEIDPYKEVDPKGKIVVVNYSPTFGPPHVGRDALRGKAGEDYASPAAYARRKGAVGMVVLVSGQALNNWKTLANSLENDSFRYRVEKPQHDQQLPLPTIYVNRTTGEALLAGEKTTGEAIYQSMVDRKEPASFALNPDKQLNLLVTAGAERAGTQNVLALWEGRDPILKHELVAISAHYDHIGVSNSPSGGQDTIYNGADDDGSGTVSLLAMAEAFSNAPKRPKRSVLFIWHCGEEKGLWGSDYFTEIPTLPLDRFTGLINIDMIGRSKPAGDTNPRNRNLSAADEVYVIGKNTISRELGELTDKVNKGYLRLKLNEKYDRFDDPERIFFRSDHYLYGKKGIPFLFYFSGVHEDYHRVSDQVEKIDFTKLESVARTIYLTLWEMAEAKRRPKVDQIIP